jgi:hypothetical protein
MIVREQPAPWGSRRHAEARLGVLNGKQKAEARLGVPNGKQNAA